MEWKVLPIGQLKPAAYNPRKQLKPGDKEYEKIKHSIQEFGYVEPIIVNYDMTVIGGHQRLTVLKELGYEEVQCVVVHIEDEHKVKVLNIALNKITGAWNEQLLADLIVDLQSVDFDVNLTGFEAPEVEQLFSKVHNKKVKEDDFDVDGELEQPAMAKAGDIWLLREHRVICGDATLPETYTRLMDGKKANLVLTDPPYNVDVEETAGKIKNDNMSDDKFYQFLFSAFVNMEQNMERDASICVPCRYAGAELPQGLQGRRFLPVRLLHLEEERPGPGPQPVPVAARAVPVRLEAEWEAPVVFRPQADNHLGI